MISKTEKKNKCLGSAAFLVLLMGITGYFVFRGQSIESLIKSLKGANPVFILIGFAMMFIYIACEGINIYLGIKALNQKTTFFKCMGYAFVGFYFSSITPSASGGQPAQVYYMKKDDINISYSSLVLLVTVVIHQVVVLAYSGIMFVMEREFILNNVRGMNILLIYGVITNVALVVGVIAVIFSKKLVNNFIISITNLLGKLRIIKDVEGSRKVITSQIEEYVKGAQYIKQNPKLVIKILLITIVQITAMFLVPFFVYKAFHLSTYTVFEILAIQSLLNIAVSSLPLPGAVGASENSFMTLFKIFFPGHLLVPAMLLSRGISFYAFVAISGLVCIVAHVKSSEKVKSVKEVIYVR
ncbi:aminohexosyl-hexosyldiradylglycerol biosynthesis protein HexF [Clostridioides difficile]